MTKLICGALLWGAARAFAQAPPDSMDRHHLQLIARAIDVAHRAPPYWAGYQFARRPGVYYRPGHWAILVNATQSGGHRWRSYPADWPLLPPGTLFSDSIPELIGQLEFDYDAGGGGRTVAVPLYDSMPSALGLSEIQLFAFINHEAFHQFQRETFADVDTPSEEPYPMLDAPANALATLELRAMRAALTALRAGDRRTAREAARHALAARAHRWERLSAEARRIETAKEVVEGSAKYVEAVAIHALGQRCARTSSPDAALCSSARRLDAKLWIVEDIDSRLAAGAVVPADMPRNRIYPLGAAAGLLLDVFRQDWQRETAADGTTRSLLDRLARALDVDSTGQKALLAEAQRQYGWSSAFAVSQRLVAEYVGHFAKALNAFTSQDSLQVTIEIPASRVARSRSSREERWVVDGGRRILGNFVAYALRAQAGPTLVVRLQQRSVLDEIPRTGRRRVTFFVSGAPRISIDGSAATIGSGERLHFDTLRLEVAGVYVESSRPGQVTREGNGFVILVSDER